MDAQQPRIDELEKALKELAAAERLLKALAEGSARAMKTLRSGKNVALFAAEELTQARKALASLRERNVKEQADTVEILLKEIEYEANQAAQREIQTMLSTLATRLSEQGRTLTGHYPELVCDVLTLAIDIGAAGIVVSLWYGPRLHRLADIPGGDVDKIAQAVAAAFTDLESSLLPDDRFLPLLLDAWHRASARRALPGDEPRCPILEVLAELAFLRQDPKFYRHPTRSNFATYDQTHLSYQLFRLQERRCRNWELSLGIATRDEVKDRESLWIPRNLRGEGVHYSTLSFRKGGQTP